MAKAIKPVSGWFPIPIPNASAARASQRPRCGAPAHSAARHVTSSQTMRAAMRM